MNCSAPALTHPTNPEPLSRLLSVIMRGAGRLVECEANGVPVDVTAVFTRQEPLEPATVQAGVQTLQSVRWSEPRIELVARLLHSVRRAAELHGPHGPLRVDGFRLKHLSNWLARDARSGDPFPYLRWDCGVRCTFCYQQGTHPLLRNLKEEITWSEVETRLRYYRPERGESLFDQRFFELGEGIPHPRFAEVLRRFREKDSNILVVPTNGRGLTPELVRELARLQPVGIRISLISATPEVRRRIMRDDQPEIAIDSLPLLRSYGVPYAISLMALPTVSFEDMERTVRYAEKHGAQYVVVHPFAGSQFINVAKGRAIPNDEREERLIDFIRGLRSRTAIPIILLMDLYERHIAGESKLPLLVTGVVAESPAARAGLCAGDEITDTEGVEALSGNQFATMLRAAARMDGGRVALGVRRAGQHLRVEINCAQAEGVVWAPIEGRHGFAGILTDMPGFDASVFRSIAEAAAKRKARRVLVLSTMLMAPVFRARLEQFASLLPPGTEVETEIPHSGFWGGNIFTGDHFVVPDFVDCIQNWVLRRGAKPDLVIVPASPFSWAAGWQRDLTGTPFTEIERRTRVAVVMI